jgi:hypothetical protein
VPSGAFDFALRALRAERTVPTLRHRSNAIPHSFAGTTPAHPGGYQRAGCGDGRTARCDARDVHRCGSLERNRGYTSIRSREFGPVGSSPRSRGRTPSVRIGRQFQRPLMIPLQSARHGAPMTAGGRILALAAPGVNVRLWPTLVYRCNRSRRQRPTLGRHSPSLPHCDIFGQPKPSPKPGCAAATMKRVNERARSQDGLPGAPVCVRAARRGGAYLAE